MVDVLFDLGLFESQDEFRALIRNSVKSFGDLCRASDKEPEVLKPLLNRYIVWFNKNIAPKAVKAMSL